MEKAQREAAGVLQREMANLTAILVQMQQRGVGAPGEDGHADGGPAPSIDTLEAELERLTNSLPTDKNQQSSPQLYITPSF